MKQLLLCVFMLGTGFAMAADAVAPKKEALTPEEKARRLDKMQRVTGGILKLPSTGKVVIINGQKRVPASRIEADAAVLAKAVRAEIEVQNSDDKFSLAAVPEQFKKSNGNAVIFIADDATLPMSLVAMEANWGVMNVAALATDNPSADKLANRSSRELLRTATVTLGGATSPNKASSMQTVQTLKDLDGIVSDGIAFDSLRGILTHLPKIGIKPPKITTYKKACQEGWAAAPTNDYQKAIWEQVKADKERGPTSPLTIVPPKK